MEVIYLSYKKEQLPARIKYYALRKFKQEAGISWDEVIAKMGDKKSPADPYELFTHLEVLLYHSLVAGHRFDDKEMTLKRDDMEFVLDEVFDEFLAKMQEQMPQEPEGGNVKAPTKKKGQK
jgi:hypothetical protein